MTSQKLTKGLNEPVNMLITFMVSIWKIMGLNLMFLGSRENLPLKLIMTMLLLLSRFSRVRPCATPETEATRFPRPWDSPGKNAGVGCHFLLQGMKVKREKYYDNTLVKLYVINNYIFSLSDSSRNWKFLGFQLVYQMS